MKKYICFSVTTILYVLFFQSCTPLTPLTNNVSSGTGKTPYDYGCKGDGKANDILGMQAYFDNNSIIEIPNATFNISGDLKIRGKKTLILNGTLRGVIGNDKVSSDGDVTIRGNGTFDYISLVVLGGSFRISDVKFVRSVGSAAILVDNDNKEISELFIDGIEVSNGPFGVLRQGAYGEKSIGKGTIQNCYIHDCRGDGIEWNVGYHDGDILIANNRIENITSDSGGAAGAVWGIGIGVAGGVYNDEYKDYVRNFKVINNQILNVRQGIHIEAGGDFEISGNKVVINSKQSTTGTLMLGGIIVYGSTDYIISDNEVVAEEGFAIWNSFGSLPNVGYLCTPRNYVVKDNKVKGLVMNWCSGKNNEVKVFNNEIEGNLVHLGAAKHNIYDNTISSNNEKPELRVDYFYQGKDKRQKYNAPAAEAILIEKNNTKKANKAAISKAINDKTF